MHVTGGRPEFQFLVAGVPGWLDTGVVIAAARCGAVGILNLEGITDTAAIEQALARVRRFAGAPFGVKFAAASPASPQLLSILPPGVQYVILTPGASNQQKELIAALRATPRHVLVEVISAEQAVAAVESGADGLIAKGHESGGAIGEETCFVLLQRMLAEFHLPVWAQGGVGLHSAAACYVAGAAGVVLDNQLLLTPESSLPSGARAALERMEGDETICLGRGLGLQYRFYKRADAKAVKELQRIEEELAAQPLETARTRWSEAVGQRIGWGPLETSAWPLGQDAALAAPLARRFGNVSGIVRGLRDSIRHHVAAARQTLPLGPGSPLAKSHGTVFPILQGPMTRVSDTAAFAAAVAESGGLPFLALALLRGPEVRAILAETSRLLDGRPWGIGSLGFVPSELRAEQLAVAREFHPAFCIIAGGRPDQARSLEQDGIATYLHVPAPALLRTFLDAGARRLIFEGRECGGHVGPRTSFVLWEQAIELLLAAIAGGVRADELHIVFAGGIHDARSAAMVAAMAAPLAEKGVRIGVLMGTAYLFTEEALATGAIVEGFQKEAIACRDTVLLESGAGHANRCAPTPFVEAFHQLRRRMVAEAKPAEEIRAALDNLTLGRLRIAAKGIAHASADAASGVRYVPLSPERQSAEGMYMIGQLAALRHSTCTMRSLHEDVSAGGSALLSAMETPFEPATPEHAGWMDKPCDVAIVGLSCLLPGAGNIGAFWTNLLNKADAITEIPKERFNADLYYDPDRKARDKICSRRGGFIGAVPFDPMRYGIPPNALGSIDPMQLLALVAVDQALQDAGYDQREFSRERTSVILGLSGGLGDLGTHYAVRASLPTHLGDVPAELLARLPEWTEDSFAGILMNVVAGRVANRFNFGGVNFTVDAACASSLAAAYVAVRELVTGASDMVVVGGVDTVQNPFGFLCFSTSQALSPNGRCSTFDQSADGIAISEGLTVLVMKRLADAERDGDRIYAVIKGIAGSSDGRGKSMTAPRLEGQVLAMRRAYRQAHVRPSTVSLIEAHGTGTVAGDATEIASLSELFREDGAGPQTCALGSVKSMLGHTKSAAGATGLMKVALALYHKVLPPTLHVEQPNARLRDPGSPFFPNVEPQRWLAPAPETPRRAGVSSFGFGGTNFHAVVEEYTGDFSDPLSRPASAEWPAELFLWRAPDKEALHASLAATEGVLERVARRPWRDVAAAVCRNAAQGTFCLAAVAASPGELRAHLAAARQFLSQGGSPLPPGVYFGQPASPARIAFLFSGQGSQHPGMLRDLALHFPEFLREFERADAILAKQFPCRFSSYIYPPPAFTEEEKQRQLQAITDTVVAQPALGALEIALHRLFERLGVRPHMTAGHSYGEYVALCAAGALSSEALLRLSEARGRAIKQSVDGNAGTMAAVAAGGSEVARALEGAAGITIANLNSPRQTIIAGSTEAVAAAMDVLARAGLTVRPIPVACAFHSPLMQPACERLAASLAEHRFTAPAIPVYSNTLADRYPDDPEAIVDILRNHLTRPVRFQDEIVALYDAGARVFVEVGPKGVLSGLARQILEGKDALILQTDVAGRHGVVQLLHVLAQLAAHGAPLEVEELFRGRVEERLDLTRLAEHPAEPGWLVAGGRAFPRTQPPAVLPPVKLAGPSPPPVAVAALPSSMPAAAGGIDDAVMLRHQQLMAQFLETQAAVMTAYLRGAPAVLPGAALPKSAPAPAEPIPAAARQPVPPPAAHRDITAQLLSLVSEKTGYPPELLDRNAGMEADLGIDSIKRVEILSAFQRTTTASEQAAIQAAMEKLTRARTLQEVVDLLSAAIGSGAAPPPATATPAAAPLAVPPAATPPRDVLADLLRIVGEKTGYPREMLDLDAGIEADLGIDSIKRVEILSAMQSLCTAAELSSIRARMEDLTRARTLRELARLLSAVTGPGEAAVAPSGPKPVVPRFRLVTVAKPRPEQPHPAYPGRVCLITDDETGLAAHLAAEWNQAGERVLLLRHSPDMAIATESVFNLDLTSAEAVDSAISAIRARYGSIGAVVHLLPLRANRAVAECTLPEWREQIRQDVRSLYLLARATESDLRQTGRAKGALFAAVTGRGGDFGLQPRASVSPTHYAVADFVKTAAFEFPEVLTKVIDLDPTDPIPILQRKLQEELESRDDTRQIGLPGDQRLTVRPQAAEVGAAAVLPVRHEWVCLLTGGARGITAQIARKLAAACQPTLILAGASELREEPEPPDIGGVTDPTALKRALAARLRASGAAVRPADVESACRQVLRNREIRSTIEALRATGSRVEYHAVDVRQAEAFGRLIDSIYREHGRLDLVVHGAGIIEDKLIRDKAPESFDRVVHTKADSAYLLSRCLHADALKALVFMSSTSAAFGNRGQADYAAANGIMNGFAAALSAQWPCRVVAMNWGPWDQAGMVSAEVRRQFLAQAIELIAPEAGAEAFLREIQAGDRAPLVIVGGGPWRKIAVPPPLRDAASAGVRT